MTSHCGSTNHCDIPLEHIDEDEMIWLHEQMGAVLMLLMSILSLTSVVYSLFVTGRLIQANGGHNA